MSKILIKNTQILSMDDKIGDIACGDILIENNLIKQIGKHIKSNSSMEIIDGSNYITMPGLIDTHRHVYQQLLSQAFTNWPLSVYFDQFHGDIATRLRPQDIYVGCYMGYLEALNTGITTVLDWANATNTLEHGLANLKAAKQSSIRTVVAIAELLSSPVSDDNLKKMEKISQENNSSIIQIGLGINSHHINQMKRQIVKANKMNILSTSHIFGDSIAGGAGIIEHLHDEKIPLNLINFAHCNRLSQRDYEILSKGNISVSITPEVEMLMGHGNPPYHPLITQGLKPSIGVDTTAVVGSNLIVQLRIALAYYHNVENERLKYTRNESNENRFNAKNALEMGTINGARALKMDDEIGSLTPNKKADLIMVKINNQQTSPIYNPYNYILMNGHAGNIDYVMVNGKWNKKSGYLLQSSIDNDLIKDSINHIKKELSQSYMS
ncbi:amidohydrolase family protein [Bacillus sp. IBL03825]|uniref:amidohydrolase family protein n=1 Tax=Bacillus sp. IBL03825 TaxID=2953580 RepID=UPI0021587655|nr:amidohydrolase family protein [Bacillus sp. IBL03825]MCR6850457.1 amidohydrolase family protein [Bacillus sp. IBL03825]